LRRFIVNDTPSSSIAAHPNDGRATGSRPGQPVGRRKVLVIDDSLMLLSFVSEVLGESNYEVTTAASGAEGLAAARNRRPDLILLDYVLPDMRGNEVSTRLREDAATAGVPVVYLAGFGSNLPAEQITGSNVIGSLNKPFTSDLLRQTVEKHMQPETSTPEQATPTAVDAEPPTEAPAAEESPAAAEQPSAPDNGEVAAAAGQTAEPWWSAPVTTTPWPETPPSVTADPATQAEPPAFEPAQEQSDAVTDFIPPPPTEEPRQEFTSEPAPAASVPAAEPLPPSTNTFFSGDSTFFSLQWGLQTIGKHRLTGVLRCLWNKATVELLARNGEIVLVTTRDPELYCPEAPITLVNVDASQTAAARDRQRETGCPMFITLASQGLVLREPAMQLVQHYGQKLFAELWTAERVRFLFELTPELPDFAKDVPGEPDVDQWALSTLRFVQFQELRPGPETDSARIPAYTRDGFERVQKLRLTVAEAQFASQFNGVRSVAQIAKNLRLDIKFARLTLFRFLALEIVECWPPAPAAKQERRGFFQRVGSAIGLGD
jgi:CheY-like chemotaxis protein